MIPESGGIMFLPAYDLGVEPAVVRGYEREGLVYFTWKDSPVVGAQCKRCHRILWVEPRGDKVLNEKKPAGVPDFGQGYQTYYRDQTRRFMQSLRPCPGCDQCEYDRFVNNVNYPRFESGKEMVPIGTDTEFVPVDASAMLIAYRSPRPVDVE